MSEDRWFCALLDGAADVYFRYALAPARRLVYVSPSVLELTGQPPEAFYGRADLCLKLIPAADRRLLRQAIRSRRAQNVTLHLLRQGVALPIELYAVAVVRQRRLVAVEGRVRLAVTAREPAARTAASTSRDAQPTQQRLTALMCEVHELLHRVLPPEAGRDAAPRVIRFGAIALDVDRMLVTEGGAAVALTSREVLVLRYFLSHPDRLVTREQLLQAVWDYRYTGDSRTVDVHISRLRRKLPALRGSLVAVKHLGYRLEAESPIARAAGR